MAKVALLIAVSEYEPGLSSLPAAIKDVDAMEEVLVHPDMGGFAKSDMTVLKNPDRQQMEMAIETLFSDRLKDDLVVLFFSGHGIKDDMSKLYFAARETRKTPCGELMRSTAVSARFVHDSMSRSRSRRQVVILDSCFSGAFADGMYAKDDGTVRIREEFGGEGRAVLTSSSSTQYSFEQQGEELSLYARFLIDGIKTGEADSNKDEFISIDELHEYASRKVREIKPEMKPEIYAFREGFSIRLAKVPPGDPRQRYRKELARFIKRGEITIVGRGILDVLKSRLGFEAAEAKAIEDEVLEPYRREFEEKLRKYEQVITTLLQQHDTISEFDRNELQALQQALDLRNEDTIPIESRVVATLKAYRQKLQAYEQALVEALRQECPLSAARRQQFQQMHQQMELGDTDVAAIISRVTAEAETYHHHLHQYAQTFATAIRQEYPLSKAKLLELQQHRASVGLAEVDVAPIEAKITTEIKPYQQKLQQYEQAFIDATQRKHYPSETTRQQLQKTWQTLELKEVDVKAIESRIILEIQTYQGNLKQYEQDFVKAVQEQYPLTEVTRQELNQRQERLSLAWEDVTPLETRITEELEEHLEKLQRYEQVISSLTQYEYPITEEARQELHRLQQILQLSDEDVNQVETQVLAGIEAQKQAEASKLSAIAPAIAQPAEPEETPVEESRIAEAHTTAAPAVQKIEIARVARRYDASYLSYLKHYPGIVVLVVLVGVTVVLINRAHRPLSPSLQAGSPSLSVEQAPITNRSFNPVSTPAATEQPAATGETVAPTPASAANTLTQEHVPTQKQLAQEQPVQAQPAPEQPAREQQAAEDAPVQAPSIPASNVVMPNPPERLPPPVIVAPPVPHVLPAVREPQPNAVREHEPKKKTSTVRQKPPVQSPSSPTPKKSIAVTKKSPPQSHSGQSSGGSRSGGWRIID